jgi:hypothetical protein
MINNPKVICCRLNDEEWESFQRLCQNHNATMQAMLRAIVIDALYDEGLYALRRQQPERREGSGETSEASGATTS